MSNPEAKEVAHRFLNEITPLLKDPKQADELVIKFIEIMLDYGCTSLEDAITYLKRFL